MKRDTLRYWLWRVQALLDKGPAHWLNLARSFGAQSAQRALGAWRPEEVSLSAFLAQLTISPDPRKAAAHFRTRTQPTFAFTTGEATERATLVEAAVRAQTISAADALCRRTFHFRGERPITFSESVDWRCQPHGNVDWRWELNRHAYFVTLGRAYAYTNDDRYLSAFREMLLDWLAHNPPGVNAPNWASPLEVAYRLNVWTWAYYHFRAALEDGALLALLRGLWLHGRFLAANVEYTSPNNHLLLQAKALAQAGLLFPEFRVARAWLSAGLRILWAEVRKQVHTDGVHAEQSALYHQIITSELLEMFVLCRRNALELPTAVLERFSRMLEFERALLKPNGEPPLLGDSALGDSYVRFDALNSGAALLNRPDFARTEMDEATLWLTGPQLFNAPAVEPRSLAFSHAGYYVMRAEAAYLIFDCGPFGYPPAPGHGHADALSFELYAHSQTLLVDPGVYSYHLGAEWRGFFRSTAAHNTITVDEQDQTILLDDWRVLRPARSTLHHWLSGPQFDFVDGEHDGYTRLLDPVVHRRQIFFLKPDYFIVLDQLTGRGNHRFDLHFHLAADLQAEAEGALVRAIGAEGRGVVLCSAQRIPAEILFGNEAPIQGWVSRHSSEKQPAPVVRYTQTAQAPVEFGTVLYPCAAPQIERLRVTPLNLGASVRALRLEFSSATDYFILDQRPQPEEKSFDGFSSDAMLTHLRLDAAGRLVSAIIHGGQTLRRDGQPVAAEGLITA
ncbi:MAG: alginate lyase family protein [Anaerolineales bacterium]